MHYVKHLQGRTEAKNVCRYLIWKLEMISIRIYGENCLNSNWYNITMANGKFERKWPTNIFTFQSKDNLFLKNLLLLSLQYEILPIDKHDSLYNENSDS
jgi:hypothetical protein